MLADYDKTHIDVYQVLDSVLNGTAVPPGAKGAMYAIIDDLRSKVRPVEEVLRAERISIAVHRLEAALRARDESATRAVRDELKSLAVAWLDARVSRPRQLTAFATRHPSMGATFPASEFTTLFFQSSGGDHG